MASVESIILSSSANLQNKFDSNNSQLNNVVNEMFLFHNKTGHYKIKCSTGCEKLFKATILADVKNREEVEKFIQAYEEHNETLKVAYTR